MKYRYYFTIYKIGYYICRNNKALIQDIKPIGYNNLSADSRRCYLI